MGAFFLLKSLSDKQVHTNKPGVLLYPFGVVNYTTYGNFHTWYSTYCQRIINLVTN